MSQSRAFEDASHAINDMSRALAMMEADNNKLRELLKDVISHVNNPPCEGCMAEMNCCAGLEDVSQCDEWSMYVANALELGIEVPQ